MAATATAESLNVDRLQAVAGIIGQVFRGGSSDKAPNVAMGATANSATATTQASKAVISHVQGSGVVSDDDLKHAAINAGLKGDPRIKAEMIQAAHVAAELVKRQNIQGTPTKEQIAEITQQAMQSNEVRALTATTQKKSKGVLAAGVVTAGTALAGGLAGWLVGAAVGAVAKTAAFLITKPSWVDASKIRGFGAKLGGSVGGAAGAAVAVIPAVFGLARNRNDAKHARAIKEIVAKAVDNAAHGRTPRMAAVQERVEPSLAPQQEQAQAQAVGDPASLSSAEKAKQMTALMSSASSATASVASPAPKPPAVDPASLSSAEKAKQMTALMSSASSATVSVASPAPKPAVAAPAPIPPAPKPSAAPLDRMDVLNNMMKAVAAAKPAAVSGGVSVASVPVGPGKTPEAPGQSTGAKIG